MTFLRIVAPHFVAGIVIGDRAAPIIAYMLRWDVRRIRDYCARKGWEIEAIEAAGGIG